MSWLPAEVAELVDARAGDRAVRGPRRRPADHLSADPAVGRRAGADDLQHPVFAQARAHQGQPARLAVASAIPSRWAAAPTERLIQGDARVIDGDPHDGVAARAAALVGQGAGHPRVPQVARRLSAVLRAVGHRGHAAARSLLAGRRHVTRAAHHQLSPLTCRERPPDHGRPFRSRDVRPARGPAPAGRVSRSRLLTWVGRRRLSDERGGRPRRSTSSRRRGQLRAAGRAWTCRSTQSSA